MFLNKNYKKIFPILAYVLGPILSLITIPIITKSFNPSEYGLYNYYILIINYILLFTFFPSVNSSILRFLNTSYNEFENDKLVIFRLISIMSFFYLLVSIVFFNFYEDEIFIYLIIAYYIINIITFFKSYLNINGKKYYFSILVLTITISQYLYIVLSYYYFKINLYDLLLGNIIVSLIFLIFMLFKYNKSIFQFKKKINIDSYYKIKKFAIPSLGIALSGILLTSIDRIAIKHLLENGEFYIGIYSINYSLYAHIINMIIAIFYIYIPFYLYTKYEKNGLDVYLVGLEYILKIFILFSTFIVALIIFNYDKINYLLFDSKYIVDSKLSIYILLGHYFFGIYSIVSNYYAVINNKKILVYFLGIVSFFNIVLNLIFIPKYGYIAASISTLICYLLLFLITYYFVFKKIKKVLINKYYLLLLIISFLLVVFIPESTLDFSNKSDVLYSLIIDSMLITFVYTLVNYYEIKKLLAKN